MAQYSGYNGYRKITRSSNVERGSCWDARLLVVVRKSPWLPGSGNPQVTRVVALTQPLYPRCDSVLLLNVYFGEGCNFAIRSDIGCNNIVKPLLSNSQNNTGQD
ncbi:hypothetical protein J6590_063957 [Homalodisca vitripennis]|nr:hypothetical protein J6590_063957 [Homalodisca vitripennis]